MKYMLLIYHGENAIDERERQQCYEDSTQLAHRLKTKGQYVLASPLQPVSTATTVRVREGKKMVTDGPFAESREYLGGFYLVHAKNLDDALEIAAQIPASKFGAVEVRPVLELPNLPVSAVTDEVEVQTK